MSNDRLARVDPQAGMTVRQGASGQEITVSGETSTAALAEMARASIEARHIVAQRRPRDWDDMRTKLLKECKRPTFAAVARYSKPIGGGVVEGPSVRFAEACYRLAGNLDQMTQVVHDDANKRILRVTVSDLETNATYSSEVVIDKTVERRQVKGGQEVLSSRTNSTGQTTYLVKAGEDELLVKQGAIVSKALRNSIMRLVPGDLIDEAQALVMATQDSEAKEDPDAARKKLADAFVTVGVQPSAIKEYIGHDLASCSPAEMGELRAIYVGIRDGETSWGEVMKSKGDDKESTAAAAKVDALKEKLSAKKPNNKPVAEPGVSVSGEPT